MKSLKSFFLQGGKWAVSLGLLIWVFFQVDWRKSFAILQGISWEMLVLYTLFLLGGIGISAKKWMLLAKFQRFHFSFWWYFQRYLFGAFLNNFFPSTVGGDTYRAISLGRKNDSYSPAAAVVFFDRVSGLSALLLLAVFFGSLSYHIFTSSFLKALYWVAVGGVMLDVFLLFFPEILRKAFFPFLRKAPQKFQEALTCFQSFSQKKNILLRALLWGGSFSLIGVGVANYILFQALGAHIKIVEFFGVIFFISIISSLPFSINNIGLKEWAYLLFFPLLGVSPELAVTAALLSRFLQMLVSLFSLPFFLLHKRRSIREMSRV